jgi:hypothetical protein
MNTYPTDEQLQRIREWPGHRLQSWFTYIQEAGNYWPNDDYWHQEDGVYHISTGGWSGNESIVDAMRENFACWSQTWESHRRGGHYVFRLPLKSVSQPVLQEGAGDRPQHKERTPGGARNE